MSSMDLDGDGKVDLLVATSSGRTPTLHALSGQNAKIRWSIPFVLGSIGITPSLNGWPLADFNQDGYLDVALWTHEENRQEGPVRLSLFGGRDGRPLWHSSLVTAPGSASVVWPQPVVGDLDGDGLPEILVTRQRYEAGRYVCELLAADGRNGQIRWTWTWHAGFPQIWPPLVLRKGNSGGAWISLAVQELEGDFLVTLDAEGEVRAKERLNFPRNFFAKAVSLWMATDLNGNGADELIYSNNGRLWAAADEQLQPLWNWTLPNSSAELVGIHTGMDPALAVWAGREVYGLDLLEGVPRWRSMVAEEPNPRVADAPQVRLLRSAASGGLPRVQLVPSRHNSQPASTSVGQTLAAAPEGRYLPPHPRGPLMFSDVPPLDPPKQPLPWAEQIGITLFFLSGALPLLLLGIPALLIYSILKRRSWMLGFLLVAYAGFSVWFFQQGIPSILAVGFSLWLLWVSLRSRDARLSGLAALYLALALLPVVAASALISQPELDGRVSSWWPNFWSARRTLPHLMGIPILVFWIIILRAFRNRRWKEGRRYFAGSLVAGVILGALVFALGAMQRPGLAYSLEGWYVLWFAGAYLAGFWGLLEIIYQFMTRKLRRRISKKEMAPKTAHPELT
jgi:outer membrane protein assembly factor BamB